MSIVELENVSKRFGTVTAVADLDLTVAPGEAIALLGPSGCGKTTTLRLIAGFERPDTGTILIEGVDMSRRRPYERNVGLLFQHYALFPHMTVEENVAYGLKHRGWPRGDIAARVGEMLALVKLSGFGDRRPDRLSGGQQQRVALARALATRPRVVLLDEPLSALDAKLRQELRVELKEILASVSTTAIVVTHDQEEAMGLADRIVVMNAGRIEQEGTPDDLYRRPRTRFAAMFIGRSNWIREADLLGSVDGGTRLRARSGLELVVAGQPEPGRIDVCIRPESLQIHPATLPHRSPDWNEISGHIVEVVSFGPERHYVVDTQEGRYLAIEHVRGPARASKGEPVVLTFRPDDCILLPGGDPSG